MIIDCISDLHGNYPKLDGGDLLIVAGDLTATDTVEEYIVFRDWISIQEYKKIIIIAGNHDNELEMDHTFGLIPFKEKATYLCDSGFEYSYFDNRFPKEDAGFLPSGNRILKIWGSPWTKTFKGMNPQCKAFTVDTEEELDEKWKMIPEDVDILITHSPPYGILDKITGRKHVGSKSLQMQLFNRLRPKLFVCGHIHESYGQEPSGGFINLAVNASHVNERYEPVNKPIRVIL